MKKILKKINYAVALSVAFILLNSCSKEDTIIADPFVVSFKDLSTNILNFEKEKTIELVYSEPVTQIGEVVIQMEVANATYGQDFITVPEIQNNQIKLPLILSEKNSFFVFKKLHNTIDENVQITFKIQEVNHSNSQIQGNSTYALNSSASLGGSIEAKVGGSNQPKQVYIDLSSGLTTEVRRNSWDLGFYAGDHFRVMLNSSMQMAVKKLNTTDMSAVNSSNIDNSVRVGTFNIKSVEYIDNIDGDILKTAISEVSSIDSENKVYLLNMGNQVPTTPAEIGSVNVAGAPRGWKKIRILREGENYKLLYADIDSDTYKEAIISRDKNYNFTFFNLNTESVVKVEPAKVKWDICYTVVTYLTPFNNELHSYTFSDFVINNRKGGSKVYKVATDSKSYTDFSESDIDESLFSEKQDVFGDKWRDVFTKTVSDKMFFILKDPLGNIYKLKFLSIVNEEGKRGFSKIEYKLLKEVKRTV